MMRYRKVLTASGFAVLCCMGMWSCEENVELNYNDMPQHIAVIGNLSTQSPFEVVLTASQFPTDNVEVHVPDQIQGNIVIDQNISLPLFQVDEKGTFRAVQDYYPEAGSEVLLQVEAPGFDKVTALAVVPLTSQLFDLKFLDCNASPADDGFCGTNVNYKVFLRFDHGANRYYHLRFYQSTVLTTGDPENPDIDTIAYPIEPVNTLDLGMVKHHESGVLIDSEAFGAFMPMTFSFSDLFFICEWEASIENPGAFFVELRTVSEDYYLYYSSLARQLQSRKDPFAEPIQIYSNVSNGVGILAGYDVQFYTLELSCI